MFFPTLSEPLPVWGSCQPSYSTATATPGLLQIYGTTDEEKKGKKEKRKEKWEIFSHSLSKLEKFSWNSTYAGVDF